MRKKVLISVIGLMAVSAGLAFSGGAPVSASTTVTLAAAGDIALPNAPGTAQTKTAQIIGAIAPQVVLPLGDEQYGSGSLSDFRNSYGGAANPGVTAWGDYNNIASPVPGNHEYETSGATGYYSYFGTPSVCATTGADCSHVSQGYYSYNVGDWHFDALNDNCSFIDCTVEKTWLRQDLVADADSHLCDLAYRHEPNKSPFWNTLDQPVKNSSGVVLDKGVDVQLSGHHHVYARFAPVNGIRLIIAGTGGKSNGNLFNPAPSTLQFQLSEFGVLQLDLSTGSYTGAFHDIDGTTPDTVPATTCH